MSIGCDSSSPMSRRQSAKSFDRSRFSPRANKKASGFTPGRNRQAFTRIGLRPGDLVTAINGTPLDDPSRGQEIFNTLGSSSEAHVTVTRNGKQQDLTLQMSQIAQEAEALVGGGNDGAAQPPSDVAQPGPGTDRD